MTETPNGLHPRETLSDEQRDEMFALLSAHFEGVTREQFNRDLAEKNWVLEIRNTGRLVGFSTLLVREAFGVTAIFSGDTIVAPEAWNSPQLARTWIAAVNYLRAANPERLCFWLLLTSGFRTYRILPVFWLEFFPNYDTPTPQEQQELLDGLARLQYGALYDSTTGIVRFPNPQRLCATLAELPEGREKDAHIAYFLGRNPGHTNGDELACITEITESNLKPAGWRMVKR